MTIQLVTPKLCPAKPDLQKLLNEAPHKVAFRDPAVIGAMFGGADFTADEIQPGERVTAVLDPQTRRRFARITRRDDKSFKVE